MRPLVPLLLFVGACAPEVFIQPKGDTDPLPVDTDPAVGIGQPDIDVTPTFLDFGALPLECLSEPRVVTITNVGDADLEISAIELRGAGKLAFDLTATVGVLAPGDSTTATVSFTAGAYTVYDQPWLEVTSNDPDEGTVQVDLEGEGAEAAFRDELFVQEQATEVDVLFSIDYSGSMSYEIGVLGQTFSHFIQQFVNLGLDYHVAVITADPDCPQFLGPVITTATADPEAAFTAATSAGACSGEAAFGATLNALSPARLNGVNAGFLRPTASLAVVAISDEAEQTEGGGGGLFGCDPPISSAGCLPVVDFVRDLNAVKGNPGMVSFSGMVGPPNGGLFGGGCSEVDPAPRYNEAIARTGGVWGDLCVLDMAPFLTHVSLVAAGVDFRFPLSDDPIATGPDAIIVERNGQVVPWGVLDGWTYDATSNSIELHGASFPSAGDVVSVRYPYDSGCE